MLLNSKHLEFSGNFFSLWDVHTFPGYKYIQNSHKRIKGSRTGYLKTANVERGFLWTPFIYLETEPPKGTKVLWSSEDLTREDAS